MVSLSACATSEFGAGTRGGAEGEGEGEGEGEVEGPGSSDTVPGGSDAVIDPVGCGGEEIPISLEEGLPPDVLLVVDRSASMSQPLVDSLGDLFTGGNEIKWDVMEEALISVTSAFDAGINWGLMLFPGPSNGCSAGVVSVPVGPDSATAIESALASTGPDGWTPTDETLENALAMLAPLGPDPRYVIFATDGVPECAGDVDDGFDRRVPTLARVVDLSNAGISTFVIGFGSEESGDPDFLADLAAAGGTGKHFTATSPDELVGSLETIAGGIIPPPCTYALDSEPDDPSEVLVAFDGQAVPRDLSNLDGWNYDGDERTISFYGTYCEQLHDGLVGNIEFIFGCSGPVIE